MVIYLCLEISYLSIMV